MLSKQRVFHDVYGEFDEENDYMLNENAPDFLDHEELEINEDLGMNASLEMDHSSNKFPPNRSPHASPFSVRSQIRAQLNSR